MEKMLCGAIAKDGKRFEDMGYQYEFMTYGTARRRGGAREAETGEV
jgi:hypothetical protein